VAASTDVMCAATTRASAIGTELASEGFAATIATAPSTRIQTKPAASVEPL
jgi:hypothetical protein